MNLSLHFQTMSYSLVNGGMALVIYVGLNDAQKVHGFFLRQCSH